MKEMVGDSASRLFSRCGKPGAAWGAGAAPVGCGRCKPVTKIKLKTATNTREPANAIALLCDLMMGMIFAAYGLKGGQ